MVVGRSILNINSQSLRALYYHYRTKLSQRIEFDRHISVLKTPYKAVMSCSRITFVKMKYLIYLYLSIVVDELLVFPSAWSHHVLPHARRSSDRSLAACQTGVYTLAGRYTNVYSIQMYSLYKCIVYAKCPVYSHAGISITLTFSHAGTR